jgi:hypothetical protein
LTKYLLLAGAVGPVDQAERAAKISERGRDLGIRGEEFQILFDRAEILGKRGMAGNAERYQFFGLLAATSSAELK